MQAKAEVDVAATANDAAVNAVKAEREKGMGMVKSVLDRVREGK